MYTLTELVVWTLSTQKYHRGITERSTLPQVQDHLPWIRREIDALEHIHQYECRPFLRYMKRLVRVNNDRRGDPDFWTDPRRRFFRLQMEAEMGWSTVEKQTNQYLTDLINLHLNNNQVLYHMTYALIQTTMNEDAARVGEALETLIEEWIGEGKNSVHTDLLDGVMALVNWAAIVQEWRSEIEMAKEGESASGDNKPE